MTQNTNILWYAPKTGLSSFPVFEAGPAYTAKHICDARNREEACLIATAPELLEALKVLRKELRAHIKLDVKKHYSLMVADAAAGKAITKATGEI